MKVVLGAIPLLALVLGAVVVWKRNPTRGWREAVLIAVTLGGAWVVAGTELLSLFSAIERRTLVAWWMIPVIGAGALLIKRGRPAPSRAGRWTLFDRVLLVTLAALLCVCGIQAALAPITNVDSLTYHLPRQVLWAQHHNVSDFSTNNARQLMMGPYAEFVGLHLMVLTGGDSLHSLIQWVALAITALTASLVARQAGAGRSGQLLAALAVVCVPEAFLEASNPKNDVVEAMWVMIALQGALTFVERRDCSIRRGVVFGIAVGAAILTKGTGIFFVAPIALVAAVALVRHVRMRAIVPMAAALAVAVGMNAGFFSRNYLQFGRIAGPASRAEGGYDLVNADKSPAAVLSNVLRNSAIEAGTPWPSVNEPMNAAIDWIHRRIGVDRNDPALTFRGTAYTGVAYHPHEEDRAGSPAEMLLALVSLPAIFFLRRNSSTGRIAIIYGVAISGFVLFCAILRWQEWNTRLLIAPLCLLAPAMGALWTSRPWRWSAPFVAALLAASLIPTVLQNDRPLWGAGNIVTTPRWKVRFATPPNSPEVFKQALSLLSGRAVHTVGFATGGNSSDYLFMRMLLDQRQPSPMFEYINPVMVVEGSPYAPPDVVVGKPTDSVIIDSASKRVFVAVEQNPRFSLLFPEEDHHP